MSKARSVLEPRSRCSYQEKRYRIASRQASACGAATARVLAKFQLLVDSAFDPAWWVHLLTSSPVMLLGCLLPLRPIKGWLVASQYVNRAQEAGSHVLWAQLHGSDASKSEFDQWSTNSPMGW
ncbi:DUF983 domain-containing protein [Sphingomonas radiodurans]|uniref:DUF983 domain-containing protein n=1 Tax=Sphingomonas radiodurans TaxID=2890321 RepID=UPI0038CD8DEB